MQTRLEQFYHLIYKYIVYDPESNENKTIIEQFIDLIGKHEMTLWNLGKELTAYFNI